MTSSAAEPRLVPVGDVELCVQEFGDPDDPVVLLLSGAAASMDWWDVGLCDAIAAGGRRVVRYDHRDTGGSTTGEPGAPAYDGNALDGDAIRLLEALDAAPAHLVGVSMGAAISQTVALKRPDLVASLTLMATTAVGGVDFADLPGPAPQLAALFEDPPPDPDWSDRDAVVEWFLKAEQDFSGTIPVDEARVRDVAQTIFDRSVNVASASNHWRVVGDDGGELDPAEISAPTLVVHGTHDPLFPMPHGEALAAVVPGARLIVVEGMGHQVPPPPTWTEVVPAILEHTAG